MQPASLFIVEDESIVASDLKETLQALGYVVAGMAKSGETALEKIQEARPDLVLMDIHLAGGMDGIDTAGKVHTHYTIPVIFLTAYADKALLERAKLTEPYGYILKPYDERALQSTIEMALYKFRADERVKENEALIRSLLDLNPAPVFILDKDTNVLYINTAFSLQKTFPAIPPSPFPSARPLSDLVASGKISPALFDAVQVHFFDNGPFKFEEEFQGTWLSHTISPLVDQNNQVSRCAVESFDITDIKKRELDLTSLTRQLESEKHSLALFAAMLDSMDDFVVATDMVGNIIYINKAFQVRFRFTNEDISGKHISAIKDPADPFALDTNSFLNDKKQVWSGSVTVVNKFGIRIKALLKSTPVAFERQNVCRVFVFRERLG
ncbi:response regulator [Methanoregula sp.]|uniref:response regulator n=1 Tax=Methanoregula sp. TaxID=2052170 RepID=UPI003565BA3A